MDLYLSQDSFQDMLDADIKNELETVLASGDFSLSMNELPPLDLDEALGDPDNNVWFSTLNSANSNSSNSNFALDFSVLEAPGLMVNPHSVLPMTLVTVTPSTAVCSTNINTVTSSSASIVNSITTDNVCHYIKNKPDSNSPAHSESGLDNLRVTIKSEPLSSETAVQFSEERPSTLRVRNFASVPSPNNTLPSLFTHSFANISKHFDNIGSSSKPVVQPRQVQRQISQSPKQQRTPQPRQVPKLVLKVHPPVYAERPQKKQSNKWQGSHSKDSKKYPKPAYSYSCLIAMALKNSKTGSLPVSEIYSFMCEHFPYFKTAPNGWKNSVRHNLSLNKCFEKIEKPSGNGSQRKGCLWAMNPEKITKMDEEVQKWSRKDPDAIRRAMVFPENLILLERGEIKRDFSSATNETEDSEIEDQDADQDQEEDLPESPAAVVDDEDDNADAALSEYIDITDLKFEEFDDASLIDFEIQVGDDIYDKLGINVESTDIKEEKVNLGITVTSAGSSDLEFLQPSTKRSRSTIQGNYVYKPVLASTPGSKRKTPLLLRTAAAVSSFVKLENH